MPKDNLDPINRGRPKTNDKMRKDEVLNPNRDPIYIRLNEGEINKLLGLQGLGVQTEVEKRIIGLVRDRMQSFMADDKLSQLDVILMITGVRD